MVKRPDTNAQRLKRHKRVRAKISGTPERPRLNVFRSKQNIYAQIVDDVNGVTLSALLPWRRISKASAATLRPLTRSARLSLSVPRPRESTPWCSTAAVTCITAV